MEKYIPEFDLIGLMPVNLFLPWICVLVMQELNGKILDDKNVIGLLGASLWFYLFIFSIRFIINILRQIETIAVENTINKK